MMARQTLRKGQRRLSPLYDDPMMCGEDFIFAQNPPASLITSSIALDLDSRYGTTLATGVSAWADVNPLSASNGIVSCNQASGTLQPSLGLDSNYGEPSLLFTAASLQQLISTTTLVVSAPFMLYVVARYVTLSALMVGLTIYSPNTVEIPRSTTTQFGCYPGSSGGAQLGGVADTGVHCFVLSQPGTGSKAQLLVDYSQAPIATWNGANGDSINGKIYVGSSDGAPYFNGSFARILIYSALHSVQQVSQNLQALGSIYSHPAWT